MQWTRRLLRLYLIVTLGLGAGCDDFEEVEEATSSIEDEVHFLGPVPGVRVLLYRGEGVRTRPTYEAEAVTDEAGRYRFDGLTEPGDYMVVAQLGGAPWRDPHTGAVGAYGPDLELRAPVEDLDHLEGRVMQVTPLTTLLVAVAEALVPTGAEFPVREAHTGFNAWLTFDPVRTPVGEPRTGQVEARRHRLVLEGLAVLAGRAADAAGVRPGTTLTAEHLLEALIRDARGPAPPARFDGRGAAGPITIDRGPGGYALSPQTVRGELADAVQERLRANRWSTLTEADIADLLHSLRCTSAPFLQSCEGEGGEDRTPPRIDEPSPAPDTPLSDVVVIEVTADDPETGIRALTLSRLDADGPPVSLDDRDDRPGVVNVVLDTTAFPGHQRVEFEARAENQSGVRATRRFGYPLANFGAGELVGQVVKGPAVAVEVRAHGLQPDGGEIELARAFTDDAGAFRMTINEWLGPVVLRAHGTTRHPSGDRSGFRDEARGRVLSWDLTHTLTTVVADFDPESRNNRPVVITLLGDFAWARARGLQRARGAELLDAYAESLELMARHFGLAGADSVLSVRPAPADEAITPRPPSPFAIFSPSAA